MCIPVSFTTICPLQWTEGQEYTKALLYLSIIFSVFFIIEVSTCVYHNEIYHGNVLTGEVGSFQELE